VRTKRGRPGEKKRADSSEVVSNWQGKKAVVNAAAAHLPNNTYAARWKGSQRLRCSMGDAHGGSLKAAFRWWYQEAQRGVQATIFDGGRSETQATGSAGLTIQPRL